MEVTLLKGLKEFEIRKEGRGLTTFRHEEFVHLMDLTSAYIYEDIVEREEKTLGFTKKFLLDEVENNTYAKSTENDIRGKALQKIAKILYSKLVLLSEKDVFYIMQEVFETREAYISELIDTFLKDVA